jgi:hypothetical protein
MREVFGTFLWLDVKGEEAQLTRGCGLARGGRVRRNSDDKAGIRVAEHDGDDVFRWLQRRRAELGCQVTYYGRCDQGCDSEGAVDQACLSVVTTPLLVNISCRDLASAQGDLKGLPLLSLLLYLNLISLLALIGRVQSVQKEVEKLTSGNETLQMYIDNLTVQMAKRRSGKT